MEKWLIILTCTVFLFHGHVLGQNNEGMLIYQIDGNRYLRKNYDAKGILKNYQTIEVGQLNASKEMIELKMTVISYDKNDKLLSASQTSIRCNPKAQEVLMGIFPFAGGKANQSLRIEMPEGEGLYPAGWQFKSSLSDFNFKFQLEGGVAGFFGTESQTAITQRKVIPQSDDLYRISGKMTMTAYLAGFKFSTNTYNFSEDIELSKGIIWQKFMENSGEYFTIELTQR